MSHAAMISEAARSADYQAGFEAAKAIYSRNERVVTHGDLTLGRIDRTVTVAGKVIALRQMHFNILALLIGGEFVACEMIADNLWGAYPPADVQATIRVHVCMLRRLLPPGMIESRSGLGYRLAEGVRA